MLHKLIHAAIITCLLQLVLHLAPPKTETTLNLNLSQVSSMSVVNQH